MATLSVSFTLSAADSSRIVAAYQIEANADVNHTASNSEVMAYIKKTFKQSLIAKVQAFETATDIAALPVHAVPDLT